MEIRTQHTSIRRQLRFARYLAACIWIILSFVDSPKTAAQSQKRIAFDVISVKPARFRESAGNIHLLPNGLKMDNFPLDLLIRFAYELDFDEQMIGLPSWTRAEHYDIEARVDANDAERFSKATSSEKNALMRSILTDRFSFSAHHQNKEMPVYDLLITAESSRLIPVRTGDVVKTAPFLTTSQGRVSMHDEPIASLAAALTRQTHRAVVDKTGLTGRYDLELKFEPDLGINANAADQNAEPLPDLVTALREQAGLELKPSKGPVDCLVVDEVKRPTAN